MPNVLDLERLAADWEPPLRDAFLKAIRDNNNRINLNELARLVETGDIQGVIRLLNIDPAVLSPMAIVQAQMFNETGAAVVASIPAVPQAAGYALHLLWNVRNPAAEHILRTLSGDLIQEITADQLTGIRGFLEKGLAAGANPRNTALDLVGRIDPRTRSRVGGIVGLHSTQIEWVENFSKDLASDDPTVLRRLLDRELRDKRFDRTILRAIKEGTGLPTDLQVKMRVAFTNNALRYRAETISRSETMKALNAAQTSAYQQNIDSGRLDASLLTRFWKTAGDSRVRPHHREIPGMNESGRKWNEPFQTPDGPVMHPPFQPNCRCHEFVRINFIEAAARQLKREA